jgi:hypothetical protein
MTNRNLTYLFATTAVAILALAIIRIWSAGADHHLLLALALAATAVSVAADPEFVMQDSRAIFSLSNRREGAFPYPAAARIALIFALVCLAAWLALAIYW